jgi:hypothetical protein
MKKTSQMLYFIVLFVLVATSYVVQGVKSQAEKDNNSLLHDLIQKRETCPPCSDFAGGCPSFLGCMFCGGCCCSIGK